MTDCNMIDDDVADACVTGSEVASVNVMGRW
jgi:hypothetical protein